MEKKFKSEGEILEYAGSKQAEEEKYEQVLSNSYFFGQFMMMDIILKLHHAKGTEAMFDFIKKKYVDIGKTHPHYITQAQKNDGLVEKYCKDTMATKF